MIKMKNCDGCEIFKSGFCKLDKPPEIIEKCLKLDNIFEKVRFAADQDLLLRDPREIFSEIFWDLHDVRGQFFILELLKKSFNNPDEFFPYTPPEYVKDQLFVELLMKFCKLAEDLGALLATKDEDIFIFTQNYIKYTIGDVIKFYKNLEINEENLSKIFNYPPIEKQDNKEAEELLEWSLVDMVGNLPLIIEHYLKYKDVYNSFKHGYRICLKDVDIYIEGEPRYNKALIYYDLKAVRKNPLFMSMICYEDFKHSAFNVFYEDCISILILIQTFIQNYRAIKSSDQDKQIFIYLDPGFTSGDYLESIHNKLKDYIFKY